MNCEICGRPAKAVVKSRGPKRSRKARNGTPRKMPKNSLCFACWEKQGDSWRLSKAIQELSNVAVDGLLAVNEAEKELGIDEAKRLRGIIAVALRAFDAGQYGAVRKLLKGAA